MTPILAIHTDQFPAAFPAAAKAAINEWQRARGDRVLRPQRCGFRCVLEADVRFRSSLHDVLPGQHSALCVSPMGSRFRRLLVAYKAKELAVMLPVVLLAYEYWFGKRRFAVLIPFFCVAFLRRSGPAVQSQ